MSSEPSGAPVPPRRRLRWRLALIVCLPIALVVIGVVGVNAAGHLSDIERVMDVVRPWLHAAQLSLTALVWLRWHRLIDWLVHKRWISASVRAPLLARRHRIMGLVLLTQLISGIGWSFLPFGVATLR